MEKRSRQIQSFAKGWGIIMAKLFMISFEGMNYDILLDWIDKSYLKNFKRILRDGCLGEMNCGRIPYEASGLTSVFSGMEESEHGICSYWKTHNENYVPEIWSSNGIKDYMFWQKNDYKENSFNIINVFGTHPAYKINGNMISYCMESSLRYTYPSDLKIKLLKSGLSYVQDTGAFFKNQSKEKFLGKILEIENMRHNVGKELFKNDADISIINFTCIDRLSHFYMNELRENIVPLQETAVFQAYKKCDEILGDIINCIEKNNADLILFSSVGFGHLKHFVEINQYLVEKGLFNWSSDRVPDWNHTVAFEAPQGCHGININKKSFYTKGIISDCDYTNVLYEVMSLLRAMRNPYNENPMFANVVLGKDFYKKDTNAPDIVLEPYDWEYLPYGDNYWADKVMRHSQTGWHRNSTVWGGLGPNISVKNKVTRITDILPLVNHIMNKSK